jgi:hypothetical protein
MIVENMRDVYHIRSDTRQWRSFGRLVVKYHVDTCNRTRLLIYQSQCTFSIVQLPHNNLRPCWKPYFP